jgi:hypothetical protein
MKIPGFTAEASLYTTEERYHMVQIISQAEGAIKPAQIIGGCMSRCMRSCGDDDFCYYDCRCICSGRCKPI